MEIDYLIIERIDEWGRTIDLTVDLQTDSDGDIPKVTYQVCAK